MTDQEEALEMIEEAKSQITFGCPECAIWRLVDAAGLLLRSNREKVAEHDGIGSAEYTGLGFRIIERDGANSDSATL